MTTLRQLNRADVAALEREQRRRITATIVAARGGEQLHVVPGLGAIPRHDEKRGAAKQVKLRLIKEAEALATSTEWGPTAGKYRDLMAQWKEAGAAPKDVDDALWKRFRGAQDTFFGNRDATNAALDALARSRRAPRRTGTPRSYARSATPTTTCSSQ